jgi:hypothetical protein
MTDPEKRARLNEIGWEIASMYPEQRGCYVFGIVDGTYKGVKYEDNIPPGQRPVTPVSGGY